MVKVLIGTDSANTRDEMFDWLRSTPGAVLISPLIKEGVSIPEIRALIMADYLSDYESMRQIIGRAIRKKPTGKNRAEIVLIREHQHAVMRWNFGVMLRKLETTEGFSFIDPAPDPSR